MRCRQSTGRSRSINDEEQLECKTYCSTRLCISCHSCEVDLMQGSLRGVCIRARIECQVPNSATEMRLKFNEISWEGWQRRLLARVFARPTFCTLESTLFPHCFELISSQSSKLFYASLIFLEPRYTHAHENSFMSCAFAFCAG
jgi:hypothetical protein